MSPAGSGILLDTSVVIDHFRGDPRMHEVLVSAAALYIPTVVLGELYYGAFRSAHRDKQLEQMRRFLRATVVVTIDLQTSEKYGRIRAQLAEAGSPIPEMTSGSLLSPCSTGGRWRPGINILEESPGSRSSPGEFGAAAACAVCPARPPTIHQRSGRDQC